jgi:glucose/arabinose dehydrogenase
MDRHDRPPTRPTATPPPDRGSLTTGAAVLGGLLMVLFLTVAACSHTAALSVEQGSGAQPQLPAPTTTLLPTVHIAPAIGWQDGERPRAAPGLQVDVFARQLDHPRWLYVLPNGDVLVAETNAPERPQDAPGLRGWVMRHIMGRAGATAPSANRITLLRDADGDGVAETRREFVANLHSPFGMALVEDQFYVADTDAVLRFPYQPGELGLNAPPTRLLDLPAGAINHHWTKNLIADPRGEKLYVTVGSNSNVGENGLAAEDGRAAIWQVDRASGEHRLYASGLRNPNGLAWSDDGTVLWTVVNERDELGSDLVPDYLTSVRDGGFYGWPWSYYGQHVDARVQPARPDKVASALVPDYALGPHTASLGLVSARGTSLPEPYRNGLFIGQHGSWNRRPFSGYRVIFVPFQDGRPAGPAIEVLGGFLSDTGRAHGRPVGVALDRSGALLVADDVGNVVWRVSAATR